MIYWIYEKYFRVPDAKKNMESYEITLKDLLTIKLDSRSPKLLKTKIKKNKAAAKTKKTKSVTKSKKAKVQKKVLKSVGKQKILKTEKKNAAETKYINRLVHKQFKSTRQLCA